MIETVIIVFVILLAAMAAMAIGVILRKNKARGELKGSCGGPELNPDCCMKKKKDCSQEL